MNRREFIKTSLLAAGGAVLLSGCTFKSNNSAPVSKVSTVKFKNLDVSLLGFGAMRLPTKNGVIDDSLNKKMVQRAIDCGVNYFDTAYMYMGGKSEKAMGDALKKYDRASFNLTTKMPVMMLTKQEDVEKIFNEQLERCQTDYFDFYLVHCLNKHNWENTKKYNVIPFLEKMKKEGKIKHLGFSHHDTPELLQEIIDYYDKWEFVQLQINKLDWKTTRGEEQYNIARKAKLPVVVMEPLRGGVLANLNSEATKILKEYNPDASAASWAFRWLAGLDGILTMLSGMTYPEHLEDNIKTFTNIKPLSQEEQLVYDRAIAAHLKTQAIGCTSCRYCECPVGVNIAGVFSLYNQYMADDRDNKKQSFVSHYEALKESERADKCIKCGLCKTKCPQQLDIPTLLVRVDKAYKEAKGA